MPHGSGRFFVRCLQYYVLFDVDSADVLVVHALIANTKGMSSCPLNRVRMVILSLLSQE